MLTHEHSDHIHGAEKIARKYGIPIYLTRGTLDASRIDPDETSTYVFENNSHFTIGELQVHASRTIHDAADPACFVIEARDVAITSTMSSRTSTAALEHAGAEPQLAPE